MFLFWILMALIMTTSTMPESLNRFEKIEEEDRNCYNCNTYKGDYDFPSEDCCRCTYKNNWT